VYERHRALADCLLYAARDLAVRGERAPAGERAQLLVVVDPTPSLVAELEVLAESVEAAFDAGPAGMRLGVVGAGVEALAPSGLPADGASALRALAFLPVPGPKNLLAEVRRAVDLFAPGGGPRSILLVTEDGGEAEDDVEATREALLDAGAVFYAIAPEAAFERGWQQTFVPRRVSGLDERFHPQPVREDPEALYYGGDVALGLVPYDWEQDLAQTEFQWVRPPRYPVPSGFGYWCLATLAFTTGGRYFLYDFSRPPRDAAAARRKEDRRTTLYDYGRLAMLAPDLRPRSRILKDLSRDPRASAIVRIWEHLADEGCPVIGAHGVLEETGGALRMRPARPVRSIDRWGTWYEDMSDVRKAIGFAQRRLDALAPALKWWAAADARARTPPDRPDTLDERIEADFQLLGVQLAKVRFHWEARRAALERIKPLHVSHRRVRLKPVILASGLERRSVADQLEDERLKAAFAELWIATMKVGSRYRRTPWALLIEKGWVAGYELDVRVIEEAPTPPKKPTPGKGDAPPAPPPTPPKPPPAGPRPGSSTDAPTTK